MESGITLQKIVHRNEFRIAVYYSFNDKITAILKTIDAKYSKTHRCWYVDYSKSNYDFIKSHFDTITFIDKDGLKKTVSSTKQHVQTVTDANRDLSPIAKSEFQLGTPQVGNPEHKKEIPFDEKVKLQLMDNIGKYWVFKMHYHQEISKKLLTVKGVFWNKNYRCFMVYRHPSTKKTVEALLQKSPFFGTDYVTKDASFKGKKVLIKPHFEDTTWMEVYVPSIHALHEVVKRMQFSRYSKTKNCYLVPAAPIVYESIQLQFEALKVLIVSDLPLPYLNKKNLPNQKQQQLTKAKDTLFSKLQLHEKPFMERMLNTLLAMNYSASTLDNYGSCFLEYLRYFDKKRPEEISNSEIIRFLGSLMQQGLSASKGHTMVNAIQFYYHQVLGLKTYDFKLPRPKKEKKLPAVLTMDECLTIFQVVDNPKHKLLLLIGYGAGLRVSEIVTLQWRDILFEEFKIHLKNAKGKKDRMVMLPLSIIETLKMYRKMTNGKHYVFEGQFAGEPYSARSAQEVLRMALKKTGLEKKATIHTLRHSFATHLLENGTDIRYIQSFLGHASIKTTMIYTHLGKSAVNKIQSPLDRMVANERQKKLE